VNGRILTDTIQHPLGVIWHGNTSCHNDIHRQSETDFEFIERKRGEIDKEIRHFLFKLEQEVPDFCLKRICCFNNDSFSLATNLQGSFSYSLLFFHMLLVWKGEALWNFTMYFELRV